MDFTKQKILVTGADGFIGSHLVEGLLDKGCLVRAFVFYNSFNSWGWLDTFPKDKKDKLDKIDVFAGDIRDPHGVRNAMQGMDMVFHLAALIAIPFSYHSPDCYVDTLAPWKAEFTWVTAGESAELLHHGMECCGVNVARFSPNVSS